MSNYKKQGQKTTLSMPVFRRSLLAIYVMAASFPTIAQEVEQGAAEEVIVYGIKQSLEDAQNIKRNASTVVDVITASDIGALPDKSIIEALQRVPGVAIERFEASDDPDHFSVEGGGVTIRGLNRVRSEFNGRDSFGAGADGGMNFSDVPPELVGSVEVAKNQTADLIEGGTAGTVNLVTRKPFDKEELVVSATVKGSYGDLIEEVNPSFTGIVSNVWDTDLGKVGGLLSVSTSNYTSRGDGVGVYNFYEKAVTGVDGIAAVPNAASARQQLNDRDRLGLAASLQWANPAETVQATLEFIRSDSTLAWNERFIEFPNQPFSGEAGAGTINLEEGYTFDCPSGGGTSAAPCQFTSGAFIGGTYPWASVPYTAGARVRNDERLIDDLSLNLEFTPSDNLTIWADIQFVEATASIKDNTAHGKFFSDFEIDLRNSDKPGFELTTDSVADAESYYLRSAMDHISENKGEEIAGQLDAEYSFDDQFITSVKAGLRFSNKEVTVRESDYNWGNVSETWVTQPGGGNSEGLELYYDDYANSGYVEQFTFDSHLNGSALKGNSTFWFPSEALLNSSETMYQVFTEANYLGDWRPLHRRAGAVEGTSFLPSEIYLTEEDRSSAYVRVDFASDESLRYSGNVGLRYVSYQLTSTGASNFPSVISKDLIAPGLNPALPQAVVDFSNDIGGIAQTIKGEEFTRVLPSFNIKVELTDELIVRFAASEGIYLPELNDVRNQRAISGAVTALRDATTDTLSGVVHNGFYANGAGNPYLQPEVSTNLDLALEWYFADFGSITTTVFDKKVDGYFRRATEVEMVTNPVNNVTQPIQSTKTINGGDAKVQGMELAAQTGLGFIAPVMENFGLQASYTYIDGETNDGRTPFDPTDSAEDTFRNFSGLPLEGLSQDNYNLVAFYDDGVFQTRFAYSWRSDYLLNSRDVIGFSPVYGEATGQLDWSASYTINDNFKIGLEANNLLNEVTKTSLQYNQEGAKTPRSYFVNDRRFGMYVQATF